MSYDVKIRKYVFHPSRDQTTENKNYLWNHNNRYDIINYNIPTAWIIFTELFIIDIFLELLMFRKTSNKNMNIYTYFKFRYNLSDKQQNYNYEKYQ